MIVGRRRFVRLSVGGWGSANPSSFGRPRGREEEEEEEGVEEEDYATTPLRRIRGGTR